MADFTPTAVSKSSNFVSGPSGDGTNDVLSDLLDNRTETYSLASKIAKRFYGAVAPTNPNVGMVWHDSSDDIVKTWNGATWAGSTVVSLNVPTRQAVLAGPVDNNGLPILFSTTSAALTASLNATVSNPVIVSYMNGFDANGAKDIVSYNSATVASFWTSLVQNTTNYLYMDNNAGVITGGLTVIAPVYSHTEPSHAAGKNWINMATGLVQSSNGSTWTVVTRVFVGTATTNLTGVTASEVYQYNINKNKQVCGFTLSVLPEASLTSSTVVAPYDLLVTNIDILVRTLGNDTLAPSGSTNAVLYKNGSSFDTVAFSTTSTSVSGINLMVAKNDVIDLRISAVNGITGTVNATYRGVRLA